MRKFVRALSMGFAAFSQRHPQLRRNARICFLVVYMFTAFTLAFQNPNTQLLCGGLVSGVAAMITLLVMACASMSTDDPSTNKNGGL